MDRQIVWRAPSDWPERASGQVQARVTAWPAGDPPPVLAIDLSSGYLGTLYPARFYTSLDALPHGGLTNDVYRMFRLVMRRVRTGGAAPENGVFVMGSPAGETGRYPEREAQRTITLTKDFYMGVFEVTQWQYRQVMGTAATVTFNNRDSAATRPMESVSYVKIRGAAQYPTNQLVGADSFMGLLRGKTGLGTFDLPSEAQWEYACRAGETAALYDGNELSDAGADPRLDSLCRYQRNGGQRYDETSGTWVNTSFQCGDTNGTARVGSFLPNRWGLYDMYGNVVELCLDWYAPSLSALPTTDPVMWSPQNSHVGRGGGWNTEARYCRSAYRNGVLVEAGANSAIGFRVALTWP